MYVKIVLRTLVMILLYKTPTNGAPYGAVKNPEINLKFRLIVSGDAWRPHGFRSIPRVVNYPNGLTRTLVFNNPAPAVTFGSHRIIRPPQPPTPPAPPQRNSFSEQNIASSQLQITVDGIPTTPWSNLLPLAETHHFNPSPVIHQPLAKYHDPQPTQIVSVQTLSTRTMADLPLKLSGLNTSSAIGFNSEEITTSTPATPVSLGLLIDPKTSSFDMKDADVCPCNDTQSDDVLNDSVSKYDKEGDFPDMKDYDDEDEDVSDAIDVSLAKIVAIRNMWEGYVPKHLLDDILREGSSERTRKKNLSINEGTEVGKKNSSKVDAENPQLWKQLQKRLDVLQDVIKAERRSNEVETEIAEMHGSDSDYVEVPYEPDKHSSHLTHLIDFWGNIVPKYKDESKNAEQNIKESIAEYNKDPLSWNAEYTKSFRNGDTADFKAFPNSTHSARGVKPDSNKNINADQFRNKKNRYVVLMRDHLTAEEPELTQIIEESVSDEPVVKVPSEISTSNEEIFESLNEKPLSHNLVQKSANLMPTSSSTQNTPNESFEEEAITGIKDFIEAILRTDNWEDDFSSNEADMTFKTKKNADSERSRNIEGVDKNGFRVAESLPSGSAGVEARVPYDPTASEERSKTKPVCKEVHDIGMAKNGLSNETQLSHIRNLVCVNDYDNGDDKDEDKSYSNEFDESTEMTREYDNSRDVISAETENDNESMDFDEER